MMIPLDPSSDSPRRPQGTAHGDMEATPGSTSPGKPLLRHLLLWIVGLLLLTGICYVVGAVVIPGLRTRAVISKYMNVDVDPVIIDAKRAGVLLPDDTSAPEAIAELGGPEKAVSAIERFLRMPGLIAPVRHKARAIAVLSQCGQRSLPVLLRHLDNHNPGIRATVVASLGNASPDKEQFSGMLTRAFMDPDLSVREAAAVAADHSRFGLKLVSDEAILHAITHGGSAARIVCTHYSGVSAIEDRQAACEALIQATGDSHRIARLNACAELRWIEPVDARTLLAAARLTADPHQDVRMNAFAVLCTGGKNASPQPPITHTSTSRAGLPRKLGGVFGYRSGGGRRRSIKHKPGLWINACGPGPAGASAIPLMLAALKHKDASTRSAALAVLGGIGRTASGALPKIRPLFDDEDPGVRANAVWAAWVVSGSCPRKALRKLLAAEDPTSTRLGTRLLWLLPAKDADFTAFLKAALRSPHPETAMAAVRLHQAVHGKSTEMIPILLRVLRCKDKWTQAKAASALGEMGPRAAEALPYLKQMLEGTAKPKTATLAWAYWKISGKADLPARVLAAAVRAHVEAPKPGSGYSYLYSEILRVLKEMGPSASPALPALRALVQSKACKPQHTEARRTIRAITRKKRSRK
jgi:HEAT repeats